MTAASAGTCSCGRGCRSHVQERCPGARRTSEFPQFLIPNICYVSAEHQVPRSERREGGRRRSWSSHSKYVRRSLLSVSSHFTRERGLSQAQFSRVRRGNWRSVFLVWTRKANTAKFKKANAGQTHRSRSNITRSKQLVSHARRESRQHEATPSLHTSASSSCSHLSRPSLVQYSSRVVTCDRVRRAQRGGA